MIFIFPQWRLGNQIFQYMFAKSISKKNERIITTSAPYFEIIEESKKKFFLIPNKKYFRYINFFLNKIFFLLAKIKVIWLITAKTKKINWEQYETNDYSIKKWLFNKIKYISWFFQYEDNHIKEKITIKSQYLKEAENILDGFSLYEYKIFVHIRRWDFIDWSVMWNNNLTLPIKFYKDQISFFQKKYKNIVFVFLSDDIARCKNNFGYIWINTYFSENSLWIDLALMTICDWAVISPSSLSFMWAYNMNKKIEIFAPNYWLGFKNKKWYPEWIQTGKFKYVDIF